MSSTADVAEERAQRAADFAALHFRWNFGVLLVDACAFFLGLAFFDSTTVLPVLLSKLGAANWQIGLTRFIQTLGFTLPSLLGAHYIHGLANHKSYLLKVCAAGRAGLLILPFVLLRFGEHRPELALALVLVVYSVLWLGDGAGAVSWFDIVAKTIPLRVRGRFFGAMQSLTGILGMGTGYAVSLILGRSGLGFPLNFTVLAIGMCAGMTVSQIALCFIKEPPGIVDEYAGKPGFFEYIQRAPLLLSNNPRLVKLIATRVLLDSYNVAAPFYILFARKDLHFTLQFVGICAVLQAAGKICGGPLWGGLTDRFGAAKALQAVGAAIILMPILALSSASAGSCIVYGVFFIQGAIQDGLWMVGSNMLLEIVDDDNRPFAVGVASLLQTPAAMYGLIGGVIAQQFSFGGSFVCSLTIAGFGLAFASTLTRPHRIKTIAGD